MSLLKVDGLHASAEGRDILRGLSLEVNPGEIHAIMGPNGSGKSTFANLLAGKDGYEVGAGGIRYADQDMLAMSPEARARAGVFLAFQYPVEIPGVNNAYLLKAALNAIRRYQDKPELDTMEFMELLRDRMKLVEMPEDLLNRSVNESFSGGEKKRNEIFQMAVLEPRLAILDETDSGLDIDALRIIAHGVNSLRDGQRAFILITHYHRLLNHIKPDFVHVLSAGRIVRSGGPELALELEESGYEGQQQAESVA